jgi:hypothetical protein
VDTNSLSKSSWCSPINRTTDREIPHSMRKPRASFRALSTMRISMICVFFIEPPFFDFHSVPSFCVFCAISSSCILIISILQQTVSSVLDRYDGQLHERHQSDQTPGCSGQSYTQPSNWSMSKKTSFMIPLFAVKFHSAQCEVLTAFLPLGSMWHPIHTVNEPRYRILSRIQNTVAFPFNHPSQNPRSSQSFILHP